MARHKSGYKITVYIDDNPNSPTYGETFEVKTMDTENCPVQDVDEKQLILNECEIGLSGYTGNRISIYWNETQQKYEEEIVADAECEPSPTAEDWVNSGNPYCETTERGVNTGYMLQPQVQMNSNLSNYGEVRISRYKSNECESNDCAMWDDIQEQCHIEVHNCLATFDGTKDITQIDINPLSDTYNQTRTINKQGSGCTNCTDTTFTWETVGTMCGDDAFLCSEGLQQTPMNLYTVTQKYKHIDGNDIPMDEYQVELLSGDSEDCGYIPPMTAWTATSQYLCDYETYTKYQMEVLMISYDSGLTWSQVDGVDPRRGAVIAEESYDCGKPMERWVETDEYVCSGYSEDYLTIESTTDNNRIVLNTTFNDFTISASTDNGETWSAVTASNGSSATIATLDTGNIVLLKGLNDRYHSNINSQHSWFTSTNYFNVYGDIMSLVYGDNFTGQTTVLDSGFYQLFNNSLVVDASELVLPATTLGNNCYREMFNNCKSLLAAPALPATTMSDNCYNKMFYNCSGLTTAPVLSATTLADNCYSYMFYGCKNITRVQQILPATSIPANAYAYMFDGCRKITTAPELPATTLGDSCYSFMFMGCSGLTTAPVLSATTLASNCYQYMFYNCTSLNYIKCLATDISASNCTKDWVSGVASSGTFVKNSSMTGWSRNTSGIPSNWTVQDAS